MLAIVLLAAGVHGQEMTPCPPGWKTIQTSPWAKECVGPTTTQHFDQHGTTTTTTFHQGGPAPSTQFEPWNFAPAPSRNPVRSPWTWSSGEWPSGGARVGGMSSGGMGNPCLMRNQCDFCTDHEGFLGKCTSFGYCEARHEYQDVACGGMGPEGPWTDTFWAKATFPGQNVHGVSAWAYAKPLVPGRNVDLKTSVSVIPPGSMEITEYVPGIGGMSAIGGMSSCSVELFEHHKFTGFSRLFYKSTRNVGGINDLTSSVKVNGRGCMAILYEHTNYRGPSVTLSEGKHDLYQITNAGGKNDRISSLKIVKAATSPDLECCRGETCGRGRPCNTCWAGKNRHIESDGCSTGVCMVWKCCDPTC